MSDSNQNNHELSTGKEKKPDSRKVYRPARKRLTAGGMKLWLREMRSELKKVVWPNRKQVINNSIIVVVSVAAVGVVIFAFDWVVGALVRGLISAFQG